MDRDKNETLKNETRATGNQSYCAVSVLKAHQLAVGVLWRVVLNKIWQLEI